ncbi:MAG: 7,8-didemethyl-8-hydroxy-5-deazariboflavin synthase subunit CofG [Candidatus Hecatellales archaeon]|nr:MAG: 7,8-didemethyl-8-hydroxy-5-deazariboflavin synthase subunit CofG [Candidatus Hecatellales archaeon]
MRLSFSQLSAILQAEASSLPALTRLSRMVKRRFRGGFISYSRKVFIPLTRLCRNACKYCGFHLEEARPGEVYLKPRQVLSIAEAGVRAGCFEALFTLGEKPEEKYSEARRELRRLGYSSTIEYLYECCRLVFKHTGLLPHSNPGVVDWEELKALREVNVSLGLMLENASSRLCEPGGPHEFSPGKNPKLRIEVIENAGRLRIAFTTGILLGIGETVGELAESLLTILEIQRRYGHIQEVIIQPFRAKAGTPMEGYPEPSPLQLKKTIIAASLLYREAIPVQTPPNLSKPEELAGLVEAGIDDWGGVSPITLDYVNPERPWPQVEVLRRASEVWGFPLKVRLPIYPKYVVEDSGFLPEAFREAVERLTDRLGYVREELSLGA